MMLNDILSFNKMLTSVHICNFKNVCICDIFQCNYCKRLCLSYYDLIICHKWIFLFAIMTYVKHLFENCNVPGCSSGHSKLVSMFVSSHSIVSVMLMKSCLAYSNWIRSKLTNQRVASRHLSYKIYSVTIFCFNIG